MKIIQMTICASAVLGSACLAFPSYAKCTSPGGCQYKFECEISDASDPAGVPKTKFAPGDTVKFSVDTEISRSLAVLGCQATVFIEAEIMGRKFLAEIVNGTFTPDDCSRGAPFVGDGMYSEKCVGEAVLWERFLTLPLNTPNSTAALLVEVQCGTDGDAGTSECRIQIEIKNPIAVAPVLQLLLDE